MYTRRVLTRAKRVRYSTPSPRRYVWVGMFPSTSRHSWYTVDSTPSNPVETEFDTDAEEEDWLRPTLEVCPISTGLGEPKEAPSDQSTSWPSLKQDKGKAKMFEYEYPEANESNHSLDSECGGLYVPIMRTPWAARCSIIEKNTVSRFGYNDYMVYHYVFIMKVATVR